MLSMFACLLSALCKKETNKKKRKKERKPRSEQQANKLVQKLVQVRTRTDRHTLPSKSVDWLFTQQTNERLRSIRLVQSNSPV